MQKFFTKSGNALRGLFGRLSALVVLVAVCLFAFAESAKADLVAIGAGGTMADVTVNPGELIIPLVTIIGTIVGACGAIWLIVIAIKWLLRYVNR